MGHSLFRLGIAVALGLCSGATDVLAASEIAPESTVVSESLLQHGTLSNGFPYAFLPRATEPGRISLRLIVNAGSLDEHDDEHGFAHFVEHMAFKGTRHYPPGTLLKLFQRLRLSWGADANAETSFTSTIYKLDLPAGQGAHLDEVLQVLGDYATGIEFDPAQVERERSVVLSELGARDTNEWQVRLKMISFYYAGTALPDHLPIGDPAAIRQANADALSHFYRRCYRPERMTLVIVGDVAPERLAQRLEHNFLSFPRAGLGTSPASPSALSAATLQAHVITDPLANAARVSIVAIAPIGPDTTATVEEALGSSVVINMLDRRLAEQRSTMSRRIGHTAGFFVGGLDNLYIHYGLEADAARNDWPAALGLLENELRRAREQGFTASEVQEVSFAFVNALRANRDGFAGIPDDQLANEVASILATGREWRSPATMLALAENYFKKFTPGTAAELLRTTLPKDRLHLVLSLPTSPEGGADAVLAAYRASAVHPLGASKARIANGNESVFPYNSGPPGQIAERKSDAPLGIELVRFANGARINLRPSTAQPNRFHLSAHLGRGTADVTRDLPGITLLSVGLMGRSNLQRLTRDELRRFTDRYGVEGNWTFNGNEFIIDLIGPTGSLPFALQSLAAELSDIKLEETKLPEAVSLYSSISGSFLNSASGYAKVEELFRATGEDPRFRVPPQSEITGYTFDTVASWLRTHWLEGPLEIGVAGDFHTEDAIAAASTTIGALSSRHELPSSPSDRIVFRTSPYRNLTFINLPDKTAVVRLFWPVRGTVDQRMWRALQIANAALVDRLRVKLSDELGATYSPSGGFAHSTEQPDFAMSSVELTFDPAKAQNLAQKTIDLADDFARHGLTKEEFARVREPLRAGALADLGSNDWWLSNVLLHAQSQPTALMEAHTHRAAFDDITRDEVNRAASTYFRSANSNAVGFIPQIGPTPKAP